MSKIIVAMLLIGSFFLPSSMAFARDPHIMKEMRHEITMNGKKMTVLVTTMKDGSLMAHLPLADFETIIGKKLPEGNSNPSTP